MNTKINGQVFSSRTEFYLILMKGLKDYHMRFSMIRLAAWRIYSAAFHRDLVRAPSMVDTSCDSSALSPTDLSPITTIVYRNIRL
jgi:hypothetical protein